LQKIFVTSFTAKQTKPGYAELSISMVAVTYQLEAIRGTHAQRPLSIALNIQSSATAPLNLIITAEQGTVTEGPTAPKPRG